MLSSLAQQTRPEVLAVDIAHAPQNGRPTTEDVIELFRALDLERGLDLEHPWCGHLVIHSRVYPSVDQLQYRGLVRNDQLRWCETKWLMFGDSDMVYCPDYFERLVYELEAKHLDATHMLSSGRLSNPKEQTEKLVCEFVQDQAVEVPNAFSHAQRLPPRTMRNCGAGFSQIINTWRCPHEGYYVRAEENKDWRWDKRGSNPKSDMQFRRRIAKAGGPRVALPEWFTNGAIHLNHDRDPEAGCHLETQR